MPGLGFEGRLAGELGRPEGVRVGRVGLDVDQPEHLLSVAVRVERRYHAAHRSEVSKGLVAIGSCYRCQW